jgi:REP element-mobilizing transposase RayT
VGIAAYCLMPNHWHLLLWPRSDGELSEVMRWITVTHTQRWHAHHHSSAADRYTRDGSNRFRFRLMSNFITVARYVERNALRAKTPDPFFFFLSLESWFRRGPPENCYEVGIVSFHLQLAD